MHRSAPMAALALSLIAVGCGGGDDSTSTSASTSSTSTVTPTTPVGQAETKQFLGATLATATAGEPGVAVVAIEPGTKSQLREGDVIVEVNGKPVASVEELLDAVGKPELGAQFTIKVVRGDKRFTLTEVQSPAAFLGTQVQDGEKGAVVVGLAPGGPAEKAGIREDDVIVAVDGGKIRTGDDLIQAVGGHSPGDDVTVTVIRDGKFMDLRVTLVENPGAGGG